MQILINAGGGRDQLIRQALWPMRIMQGIHGVSPYDENRKSRLPHLLVICTSLCNDECIKILSFAILVTRMLAYKDTMRFLRMLRTDIGKLEPLFLGR